MGISEFLRLRPLIILTRVILWATVENNNRETPKYSERKVSQSQFFNHTADTDWYGITIELPL